MDINLLSLLIKKNAFGSQNCRIQPKHPEGILLQYWWFEQAVQQEKILEIPHSFL